MGRLQSVIAAVAAILLLGLILRVAAETGAARREPAIATATDAGADGATSDAAPPQGDAAPLALLGDAMALEPREAGSVFVSDLQNLPDGDGGGAGANAPRQVRFGIVLVQFAGAQGAPATARDQAKAQALAAELVEEAKKDFKAAVKKGDSGSTEDAGRMHRGILEPGPERVLFALGVGEVGGPVETPRGYWIVKRLE